MTTFSYAQKVRFRHCDPAGIVFYPRYFEMINETVEEWFAARLQVSFEELHGPMEAAVPTAVIDIVFTAPSRLGEDLEFRLEPTKIGGSSVTLMITAICGAQQRLKMNSTLVFIDQHTGRPQRWPDNIRTRLEHEINKPVNDNA